MTYKQFLEMFNLQDLPRKRYHFADPVLGKFNSLGKNQKGKTIIIPGGGKLRAPYFRYSHHVLNKYVSLEDFQDYD